MKVSRDEIALRLRNAYTSGAVPPLRDGLDPLDAEGAYAVQSLNTSYWRSQGRRIVGRKIGLTAKAVQAQLGVDRPDYGVLFDDMQIANSGELPGAQLLQPKAEAEVALVMAHDLDNPRPSLHDVLVVKIEPGDVVRTRVGGLGSCGFVYAEERK